MLRQAPIRPDQAPNSKYRVPMSLWFVENSQRVIYTGSMADIAADCKSVYGDRGPLLPSPEVSSHRTANPKSAALPGASPFFLWQNGEVG